MGQSTRILIPLAAFTVCSALATRMGGAAMFIPVVTGIVAVSALAVLVGLVTNAGRRPVLAAIYSTIVATWVLVVFLDVTAPSPLHPENLRCCISTTYISGAILAGACLLAGPCLRLGRRLRPPRRLRPASGVSNAVRPSHMESEAACKTQRSQPMAVAAMHQ